MTTLTRTAVLALIAEAATLPEVLTAYKAAEDFNEEVNRQIEEFIARKGITREEFYAMDMDARAEIEYVVSTIDLTRTAVALAKGGDKALSQVLRKLAHNVKFVEGLNFFYIKKELDAENLRREIITGFGA